MVDEVSNTNVCVSYDCNSVVKCDHIRLGIRINM